MKLFITDESNISKDNKFDFFIYGGIIVDEKDTHKLSQKIINLKKSLGVKKERPIKWNNQNWKKQGCLDEGIQKELKKSILEMVSISKIKIIICLSPQDFYHEVSFVSKLKERINPKNHLRTQIFAINTSLSKFDSFLDSNTEKGIVIADTFNTAFKKEVGEHCFDIYPDKYPNIIYPVIQLDNEYSHLHQINDVVLGAITWSMREARENFLPILKDKFWIINNDFNTIFKKGINIYPKRPSDLTMRKILIVKDKFERLLNIV